MQKKRFFDPPKNIFHFCRYWGHSIFGHDQFFFPKNLEKTANPKNHFFAPLPTSKKSFFFSKMFVWTFYTFWWKKNFFVQSDTLTSYLRFENLALCLRLGFWWFFLNFGDFWSTKGGEKILKCPKTDENLLKQVFLVG